MFFFFIRSADSLANSIDPETGHRVTISISYPGGMVMEIVKILNKREGLDY